MTVKVRGQLGIAALLTAAGTAGAAENLPPLRVDPALLGAPPAAKPRTEQPPAAPAAVSTPVDMGAAAGAPASTAAKPGKPPMVPKAAPMAPPPVASQSAAASPAPEKLKERPVKAPPAPERTQSETVTTPHQPPQVADRPRVPPLYSAHVKAGMIPGAEASNTDAIYLVADRMDGTIEQEMVAEGNVELHKRDAILTADKVTYWTVEDEAEALGNARLRQGEDTISGPKMRMNLTETTGYFEQPKYSIRRESPIKQKDLGIPLPGLLPEPVKPKLTTGVGQASRIDFEGEGQYQLTDATYSTCNADSPDWYAEFGHLKLDYDAERGTGRDSVVVFKGVPILYSPWMSFSLNNQRKSGLLAPTFASNTSTGFQYLQPFYWNIAPNMDATISSRAMAKRGIQLNADVRYLDYNYSGVSRIEMLPDDREANRSRGAFSILHNQNFGAGLTGTLNLNGVSDDNYFADLSTRISQVSQGNLAREGALNYSGGWWSANLMGQSYQTLQDPANPIVEPYARLPRIAAQAERPDLPMGSLFSIAGEYVNFAHSTNVEGQRLVLYPQLSLPLQTSAFYVTPKIGMHVTRYGLSKQAAGVPESISRDVPVASIDSGVTFERATEWFGKNTTQTLEPRLYYVYIPNREQSQIPVFDTALKEFNFAQIFSENRYSGSDRIGDANQLTAALTSRLIDPNTGVELLRGLIGQRYYFSDQYVTLPNETPRTSKEADWLASLSGLVMPRTYLSTTVQYNPRDARTERFDLSGRYQPEIGKVLGAGYRYTRDQLGQIDIAGQWPFGAGWSGVGRFNYSTKDSKIVEGVAGLEYNAGCWAVRAVVQQLATTAQKETTTFYIQLELSGFSNIGSNPTEILRRTVPGYSRSGNYTTPFDNTNQ